MFFLPLITGRGIPLIGDWVPLTHIGLRTLFLPWLWSQHSGALNANLRAAPWLGTIMALSGRLNSFQFQIINRGFILLCIVFPYLSAYNYLRSSSLKAHKIQVHLLSIFYAVNPWITSQLASGHFGIVLAYAIFPLLLFLPPIRTPRQATVHGLLLTAMLCFSLHIGVFAVVAVTVRSFLKYRSLSTRALVVMFAVLLVGNLYWIVPDLTIAHLVGGAPFTPKENPALVANLSRNATFWHIFSARTFWWKPFTNGFYRLQPLPQLVPSLLFIGPIIFISGLVLSTWRERNLGKIGSSDLVWIALLIYTGLLVPLLVHSFPYTFESIISNVPLGDLLRDPTMLQPFYLIGLLAWASLPLPDSRIISRIKSLGLSITLVAMLVPWGIGYLTHVMSPKTHLKGTVAAINWLNKTRVKKNERILWLPTGSYTFLNWPRGEVSNPVYTWERISSVGPALDPAFDFNSQVSLGLIQLNQDLLLGGLAGHLNKLLLHQDIRYIGILNKASSPKVTSILNNRLSKSKGIQLVKNFNGITIFRVKGLLGTARTSNRIQLYNGTWTGLANAISASLPHHPTFISFQDATQLKKMRSNLRVGATISNIWQYLFSGLKSSVTLNTPGRKSILGNMHNAYYYTPNSVFHLKSKGIIAVEYSGNSPLQLRCSNTTGPTLTNQQPYFIAGPYQLRWWAKSCFGSASLYAASPIWLARISNVNISYLRRRVHALHTLLMVPGSAYIINSSSFTNVSAIKTSTYVQNPIYLPKGAVNVDINCAGTCPSNIKITLVPDPVAKTLLPSAPYSTSVILQRKSVSVASGLFDLPGGSYQLFLQGLDQNKLLSALIQRHGYQGTGSKIIFKSYTPVHLKTYGTVALSTTRGPYVASQKPQSKGTTVVPASIFGAAIISKPGLLYFNKKFLVIITLASELSSGFLIVTTFGINLSIYLKSRRLK